MSRFIDADRLKAEIERRIELHDSLASNAESEMIANLEIGAAQALDDLLSFINTLQKEVEATAVGKVFTNTDPMNLYVESDQWAAMLGQFDNGQRVRVIIVKEDAE